jgi:hypothetical protein
LGPRPAKPPRKSRLLLRRIAAATSPGAASLLERCTSNHISPLTLALAALPEAGQTQFTDPFGIIDPAWGTNRSAPAGFTSILFGGDRRLQLTVDQTGGTSARAPGFGSTF